MTQYESLPDQQQPRQRRSFCGWWWQELLSIAASLGCISAVVVILKIMENRDIEQWTFFFSINATIAVFITAAKSTAMLSVASCVAQWKWVYFSSRTRPLKDFDIIDEAAHGPWGALNLIVRVPWGTATLGALVIILALGIDTFAQQVIQLQPSTRWDNDGRASFELSRVYNVSTMDTIGDPFVPDPYSVDTAMQGAVFKAFYNLDTPAVFSCSTNCTWPDSYISMGLGNTCRNVTEATYATSNCTEDSTNGGQNCTMTTPGGVTFSTAMVPTMWDTVLVIAAKAQLDVLETGEVPLDVPSTFMRIVVFRRPSDYRLSSGQNDTTVEQTLECDLALAAYQYTNASSISNNFSVQRTDVLALEPGRVAGSFGFASNKSPWSDTRLVYNATTTSANTTTTSTPSLSISASDMGALLAFFPSDSFSGTLVDGEEPPTLPQGLTAAVRNPARNVSQLLDAMARSMTDRLRATTTGPSDSSNALAVGLTASAVVLVHVAWVWLTLPIVVVGAAAGLLCAEMVQGCGMMRTMMSGGLWKGQATVLLFYSVSRETRTLVTEVRGPEELEALVKGTWVRLRGVDL